MAPRLYDFQAVVDCDSPDPTNAIHAFLHNMDKARALGMTPRTEHTLAEHLFRGDAKLLLYSSFSGVMALVGDEDLFSDDDDIALELLKLTAECKRRRTRGKRAAEAVAQFARDTMALASGIETEGQDPAEGLGVEHESPAPKGDAKATARVTKDREAR